MIDDDDDEDDEDESEDVSEESIYRMLKITNPTLDSISIIDQDKKHDLIGDILKDLDSLQLSDIKYLKKYIKISFSYRL